MHSARILPRKLIVIPIQAGPKFTLANSTTAINVIHIAQNGSQKVSLYLNATPCGLAGYNLTVSFRNTITSNPVGAEYYRCQHHKCEQAGMDTGECGFLQVSNCRPW